MIRFLCLCVCCCVITLQGAAQISPKNYDTLNRRMIAFEVPAHKKATDYVLDISEYNIGDASTIVTPVLKATFPAATMIATVPAFGKNYMWRVWYTRNGKVIDSTKEQFFSTGYTPRIDANRQRLVMLDTTYTNQDMLLFVDDTRAAYDHRGNPIWYLPDIPGVIDEKESLRDLKLTPWNTITFLVGKKAYEADVDGKILWEVPDSGVISGERTEQFHHEFTRLKNGHYMIMGTKNVCRPIPAGTDPKVLRRGMKEDKTGTNCKTFGAATLIEYDAQGKVVWSWLSDDHFSDEDLFSPTADGRIQPSSHMNAFYFDEEQKVIYTSHRNIHRIVKIAYPAGKILSEYGVDYMPAKNIYGNGLFFGQHGCRLNSNGNLYLYNNNNNPGDSLQRVASKTSTIQILQEPVKAGDTIRKIWEFACDIDTFAQHNSRTGGSVYELADKSLLVCMGNINRIFIVTENKKIVWNGIREMRDVQNNWIPANQGYRVFAVEEKERVKSFLLNKKLIND